MGNAEQQRIFGGVVRAARECRHVSQEALADAAGLHRTYISLLERGLRNPSLTVIVQLAEALDATPSELLRAFEQRRQAQGPS
ncbi:helix-turn-helix domain-containing protein [Deinococcus aquaedulcis]|uniref:helix-turn-helix domain-containing protein n=1 Tax=Deinococcus aquaedulcis TaxID=2840455 RepID=UPI002E2DAB88|nr:helix-turn-helix transcriptional regulator [Deinococcus aquaedulcis]